MFRFKPAKLGLVAAGLALVAAGTLARSERASAHPDDFHCSGQWVNGYCEVTPYGVSFATTPTSITFHWQFGDGSGDDAAAAPGGTRFYRDEAAIVDIDYDENSPNGPYTWTDTGLVPNTTYFYNVCSIYGTDDGQPGEKLLCAPVAVKTAGGSNGGGSGGGTPPPATPKGNPPTKVHAKVRGYVAMEVAWTPPSDDWTAVKVTCADQAGGGACKFPYITDQPGMDRWQGIVRRDDTNNSEGNALVINNLLSGHTYNITVCTVYAVVKTDTCAPVLAVQTLTPPSNLQVLSRDANGITIGWDDTNDEGVTGYLIERDGVLVATRTLDSLRVSSPVKQRLNPTTAFVHLDQFSVDLSHYYHYTICPQHENQSQEFALGDSVACASVESPGTPIGVKRLQGPPLHPTLP